MKYFFILLLAMLGLLVNMSFVSSIFQPDWSLAILLALLLTQRNTWFWVLPLIGLHDFLLFWTVWVTFPFAVIATIFLTYADERLAPGQPQRWLALAFGCLPLFFAGLSWVSCVLTLMLATWIWSSLSSQREKVYVEPT